MYQNGSLSNVYNTLGLNISATDNITNNFTASPFKNIINGAYVRNYIPITDEGWISNPSSYYTGG